MSDIEFVINHSKEIEKILYSEFNAEGKGIHEKLSTIETKLPVELCKDIRYIATIRNKIVHEEEYKKLEDKQKFNDLCNKVKIKLRDCVKTTL